MLKINKFINKVAKRTLKKREINKKEEKEKEHL